MRCNNNHVCRLRRSLYGDVPYCACPHETIGALCQQKAPAVTLSPASVALVQAPVAAAAAAAAASSTQTTAAAAQSGFSVEFAFRTTLPDVHIVSGETLLGGANFALGLADGALTLTLAGVDGARHVLTNASELRLNDASWYAVALAEMPNAKGALVELTDVETGYILLSRILERHTFDVFALRFGRRAAAVASGTAAANVAAADTIDGPASFSGCLRGVRVNRQPVDLTAKE